MGDKILYELKAVDYGRVRPLFQAMDHHLAARAILEGRVRAKVLVDGPVRPRVALTWTKHRFYLSGWPGNDEFDVAIGRYLAATLYDQGLASGASIFVLYYEPQTWKPQIERLLEGKRPTWSEREYYQCQTVRNDWRALLPDGFVVRLVDRALMEQRHLANHDSLVEEMCSERPSMEDFLAQSFGVCMLHGDEIVGWCLSEYNFADRCEVGIEVLEPYRRRGLGTVMTSALVEQALSKGVTRIGWHCYASNVASGATARRVGFVKARDYAVYVTYLDEIDRLAVHGEA